MAVFSGVRRTLRIPLGRHAVERDVDDELRFHLEMRTEELVRQGVAPDRAVAQAEREFGDLRASRRELTDLDRRRSARERRAEWFSDLLHDLRFAVRLLRRQPGFTTVILLTLALGIGANSAIFTVVQAALLEPLPYREPDALVHLWETHRGDAGEAGLSEASYPDFRDWRAQSDAFAAIEGYDPTNVTVTGGDEPVMVGGGRVTAGFFSLLGVTAAHGRLFLPGEDRPGGTQVVVLADGFWRRRFGGDSAVLGRTLHLDRRPYTVVGVLPLGFQFAPIGDAQLWVPLDRGAEAREERFNHWLRVVARLRDGVTIDGARVSLATVMRRLGEQYPETNSGRGIRVVPLRDEVVGDVRPILLALFGAVALVLLIACANVASLLLARSMARGREMAVRAAIGASRGRLVRQLLSESVLLALAGGALGVWVATQGVTFLVAAVPDAVLESMPYLRNLGVSGGVLAYTAAIALVTGLVFGLAPALAASRPRAADLITQGVRATAGTTRGRMRDILVSAEIALTVVLLVGAGLMTRSLIGLLRVDPGFRPEQVITLRVALSGTAYDSARVQQQFFAQLLERVRALPGVRDVGAVTNLPLNGGGTNTFRVEGHAEPDAARRPEATMRGVAGDYFRAMGIRLVAGRTFTGRDVDGTPLSIVINESLARQLFSGQSAVGERFRFYAFPESTWQIIGVVGDVKTTRLDADSPPTVYYTHLQAAENRMSLAARVAGDPALLTAAIRREVHAIDPSLPVYAAGSMQEAIARSPAVFARRYPLVLIGAFAAAALVLAVVGIYGVISYAVQQRTRELGIRIALGARHGAIVGMVLRHGAGLATAGIIVGAVVATGLARALGSMLYGVSTRDPLTYAAVATLLAVVALMACYIPARRATKVDPMIALRAE